MKVWQKTKTKKCNSVLSSFVFLKLDMNQKMFFHYFEIPLKVKNSLKGVTVETGIYHVA